MSRIKIVSGGQTGVDVAALRAAKQLAIPTGGWMPLGWLTEDGPRPDFAELYGLLECQTPGYPHRTRANVRDSRTTLWYGPTGSAGFRATHGACVAYDKRLLVIERGDVPPTAEYVIREMGERDSIVVNCAGSRESGNPGIGKKAEKFWLELFAELLKQIP